MTSLYWYWLPRLFCRDIHTKLNFTDADSTSGASFLSGVGKQLSRFNITSNLEDKVCGKNTYKKNDRSGLAFLHVQAKLLHSQVDGDFPMTEIGRPLKLKAALPNVDSYCISRRYNFVTSMLGLNFKRPFQLFSR